MSSRLNSDDKVAHKGDGLVSVGTVVFIILAVLTGGEFVVAKEIDANFIPLAVIAFVKAGFILWYFMHVVRAWRSGEGSH